MNAVGIDVSKGKSMVAIMRPFGEIVSTPFEIKHTTSDIRSLIELINSIEGESRIIIEHSGRYYEVLANQLLADMRRQVMSQIDSLFIYSHTSFRSSSDTPRK